MKNSTRTEPAPQPKSVGFSDGLGPAAGKSQKATKLRLYVWTGFSPDYTAGLAVAIAASEESAKKQIVKAMGYDPYTWGTLHVRRLDQRTAFAVSGGS